MSLAGREVSALQIVIRAAGRWDESRTEVRRVPTSWRPDASTLRRIDEAWEQTLARGVKLFDGAMCRLESFAATVDRFRLDLSETSYRLFLGTNLLHSEIADRHGPAALANPVGVSIAVLSRDRALIFGRRNQTVAYYPGRLHPFAGALEPRDQASPFNAVARELAEEAAIGPGDHGDIRLLGLVDDLNLRQPELIFATDASLDCDEIRSRLDLDEHHGIEAVEATASGVWAALRDPRFTPVAAATLLLWGTDRWGQAWAEQTISRLAS